MRRTATLAATAALAGGLLLAGAPAQAATGAQSAAVARGPITCNPAQLRQQAAEADRKAAVAKREGFTAEATKQSKLAAAYRAKAKACEDADNNA
ncbi:hypothetical protein [Streptomyces sp. NBC_01465]|uniref:hypothetical protein n=1 Tax=Streptomyces sp. NBC_01465 TaxID=2903878 RepID=UPI002E353C27|nr:hypothetical protein [Streptomyces sp. NBC_01465]